jgi:hypothetical protein
MAVSGDQVFRIIMGCRLLGQQCLNTGYFITPSAGFSTANEVDICRAFWDAYESGIRSITGNDSGMVFEYVSLDRLNSDMVDARYDVPLTESLPNGGSFGQPMPPYTAFAVSLTPTTNFFRRGKKRIGGVCEGQQTGGEIDTSVVTAVSVAMQPWVAFPVTDGGTSLLVSGRLIRTSAEGSVPPPYYGEIVSVQVSRYLSTQNTRKYLRGT